MLSVDQATDLILARTRSLGAQRFPLAQALGLILAEPIRADLDLPPFDKALMDGYAVRSIDLTDPVEYRLRVVQEILAGQTSDRPLEAGETARIMTGAPLPPGADAVVMSEKVQTLDDDQVIIQGPVPAGLARLPQGREMRSGELLLEPGTRIGPATLGLIASSGRGQILAIPRPVVRVVPTGDELVDLNRRPGPGAIRNTNGPMLVGFAQAWGAANASESPIAPDDPAGLRTILEHSMAEADVLLISGGVSAGAKDLVPAALRDLGVEQVFHQVRVKPGKPLWFGVGPDRGDRPGALVFGLPGNPASGAVGFLLFVRPALEVLAGRSARRPPMTRVKLGQPFEHRGDRPTYHPARISGDEAFPLDWAGSSDLRTVALADGFIRFEAGDRLWRPGDPVDLLALDR